MGLIRKELGRVTGQSDIVIVPVSFESTEAGANPVTFPFPVLITGIYATITKTLAGTDGATITGSNSGGVSANGQVNHGQGAAAGISLSALPTTNNVVAAGGVYTLTSAKTTPGGKALVTVAFKRI